MAMRLASRSFSSVRIHARSFSVRVDNARSAPDHIKMAQVNAQRSQAKTLSEVPVLDFAPFRSGDAAAKAKLGARLLEIMKDLGFVTLVNHGLPAELNERTFNASADVFNLPREVKKKYAWVSPESNRGWLSMGQELLDGDAPDLKETFEIGNEAETVSATG